MEILYLLIPVSVVLVFIIGMVFWWSLRHGQFDDLEGPGYRILMDDDSPRQAEEPGPRANGNAHGGAAPSPKSPGKNDPGC